MSEKTSTQFDLESLRKEYCPPLDEALFFALALDFDLDDGSQVNQLRQALDSLKEGAIEEQELELLPQNLTDLDPSAGSLHNHDDRAGHQKFSETIRSGPHSANEDDAEASITTGFSSLGISDTTSQDHDAVISGYGEAGDAFETLSKGEKALWLMSMFPSIGRPTIENVLAKCNEEFERTTDELLNETFLRDSGIAEEQQSLPIAKGIEGFASSDNEGLMRRKRKGRNGRIRNQNDYSVGSDYYSDSTHLSGTSTPDQNVWTSGSKDIDFITSRTDLKAKSVASLYHANGARLAPTVRAILIKQAASGSKNVENPEEVIQWQIEELKGYFEDVSDDLIHAALMLARRNPSAAKELLDVMVTSKEQPTILGKTDGLATYAPLELSSNEPNSVNNSSASARTTNSMSGGHTITHMGNVHGLAAANAFNQASLAYKRGKSDRLMGGAAAYYASVGHEHLKAAKASQAHEADAHVARQSSGTTLDLHGVNVANAIRIAKDATESWWDELGDRKYVPVGGVGNGYKIVTGIGRHSADGVGRIGPAVSKMLVREGWKVEVGQGEIIVWGRARKK